MQLNNSIIIAKNVPLTTRLKAKEIWVSGTGEVTIFTAQFGPAQPIPKLNVTYLESLCSKFYFGGIARQNSIADMLMLNGILARSQYDDFYYCLSRTLNRGELTIIASILFR